MHILYDHQVFNWQQYGGISRYFYELTTHLLRNQPLEVSLFLGFHVNKYDFTPYRPSFKHFFGIRRSANTLFTKACKRLNNALFQSFACPAWDADLYHQTYYAPLANRFSGVRVVTVHDMIHEVFPHYFRGNDKTTLHKKLCVQKADGIICVSESTKKDLMDFFPVPERKIRVIYHGNSLRISVDSPPAFDHPYILYVGSRSLYKSFDTLLNGYARSERVNKNYRIVCFGGGGLTNQEKNSFSRLGLTGKIIYCDGDDALLANLYHFASAFVCTSRYEGFGIPLIEAMYHGCPVVASNQSSLPEVAGKAALYFNPADPDDLISKLEVILSDTSVRQIQVQRGYQREAQFSWDRCAKETFLFYKELYGADRSSFFT